MSWLFGGTKPSQLSPASKEMPLLNSVNGGQPSKDRTQSFRRGGNNPTSLNRLLNVVKPLKTAEKKKYRLSVGAKTGNLNMVKQALNDGAVVDAAMNNGVTPLYIASENGHLEVVRELLARGAAVDAARIDGLTPLYAASHEGHLEVAQALLERGAAVDAARNDGATPLFVACQNGHLEVVRELLARGATVDAAMNDGATPLYIASQKGHLEVVRELLARGATVDAATNEGSTPLLIASQKGHLEVVWELRAAMEAAKRPKSLLNTRYVNNQSTQPLLRNGGSRRRSNRYLYRQVPKLSTPRYRKKKTHRRRH